MKRIYAVKDMSTLHIVGLFEQEAHAKSSVTISCINMTREEQTLFHNRHQVVVMELNTEPTHL